MTVIVWSPIGSRRSSGYRRRLARFAPLTGCSDIDAAVDLLLAWRKVLLPFWR